MLSQAEPKLRHREPVGLGFKGGRFLRELETALRPRPEFVGKFHLSYHPFFRIFLNRDNPIRSRDGGRENKAMEFHTLSGNVSRSRRRKRQTSAEQTAHGRP